MRYGSAVDPIRLCLQRRIGQRVQALSDGPANPRTVRRRMLERFGFILVCFVAEKINSPRVVFFVICYVAVHLITVCSIWPQYRCVSGFFVVRSVVDGSLSGMRGRPRIRSFCPSQIVFDKIVNRGLAMQRSLDTLWGTFSSSIGRFMWDIGGNTFALSDSTGILMRIEGTKLSFARMQNMSCHICSTRYCPVEFCIRGQVVRVPVVTGHRIVVV